MATKNGNGNGKLSERDFVVRAIKNLRTQKSKGIHTRFSGFNEAYRNYYGKDPVAATTRLIEAGVIAARPCKGGVMIYVAGEEPQKPDAGKMALDKILA